MDDVMARRILLDVDFDFFVRASAMLDWGHGENSMLQEIVWGPRVQGAIMAEIDLDWVLTPPDDVTPEDFWIELRNRGFEFGDEDYDPICVTANSHASVARELVRWMVTEDEDDEWEIWHFDAHHDLGYEKDPVDEREKEGIATCADWLYLLGRWQLSKIKKIVIVYPEWRRQPDCLSRDKDLSMDEREEYLDGRIEKLREVGCEVEIVYWNDLLKPDHPVTLISTALSSGWVPPWYDRRFERFVYNSPAMDYHFDEFWQDTGIEPREGWPETWAEVAETFAESAEEMRRGLEKMAALAAAEDGDR